MELLLHEITYKTWNGTNWQEEHMLSVGTSEEDAIEQAKRVLRFKHSNEYVAFALTDFNAACVESVFGYKITVN